MSNDIERAKVEEDLRLVGNGFLVDGVRVAPHHVVIVRRAADEIADLQARNDRLLDLALRLHAEELLSEGQIAEAAGLDRVEIRRLADAAGHRPHQYVIGSLTVEQVFRPAGLADVSDLQALLNAVESALAARTSDIAAINQSDRIAAAHLHECIWGMEDADTKAGHARLLSGERDSEFMIQTLAAHRTLALAVPGREAQEALEERAKRIVFRHLFPMHPYYTEVEMQHTLEREQDSDRQILPSTILAAVQEALSSAPASEVPAGATATVTFGRPKFCASGTHEFAAMATTGMMSCTRCQFMRQMTPDEFAHWNPPFASAPKPGVEG